MSDQDLPIAPADRSHLTTVASTLSPDEARQFKRLLPGAAVLARSMAHHWDFVAPAAVINDLIEDTRAFPRAVDWSNKARLRRAAVARLALEFFRVDDPLPQTIQRLYPDFLERLAKSLLSDSAAPYEGEFFAKDVRYALGVTVPCGALQFDLDGRIGPKLILRDVLARKSFRSPLSYTASWGWGRWYNIHMDLRAMKDFTPDGWTASCVRLAEMLKANPDVRGVNGVSWFYDPHVAEITPHLGYLQQTPSRHGAFLVHIGTASHDIENATVRSPIRKKHYDEGKYVPTSYLLAWPRRALIAWANRLETDPSVRFSNHTPVGATSAAHPVFATPASSAS